MRQEIVTTLSLITSNYGSVGNTLQVYRATVEPCYLFILMQNLRELSKLLCGTHFYLLSYRLLYPLYIPWLCFILTVASTICEAQWESWLQYLLLITILTLVRLLIGDLLVLMRQVCFLGSLANIEICLRGLEKTILLDNFIEVLLEVS